MDLKQLDAFVTIHQLQSFTRAGDTLGYAQSTITTQIQMLERELEARLFERLNHRVSLTPEGKRFLPYAEQILRLAAEAKDVVADCETPRGVLTIGAVESLCVTRLPRLLGEYRNRYPDVELALQFGTCGEFMQSLRANTMDLAFMLSRRIDAPDLVTVVEFPEPLVFLAAPGHPLAAGADLDPSDLNNQALILTEPGCSYRAMLDEIIRQAAVKPRSILEIGNIHTIKRLTQSNLGITLLPKVAVAEELKRGSLINLNWRGPAFDLWTQVVHHKQKWLSASLKAFLELVHTL